MFRSTDPSDEALEAKPKAAMRACSVFSQVQEPVECFARKFMGINFFMENVEIIFSLTSSDDFAVALGRQHIDP